MRSPNLDSDTLPPFAVRPKIVGVNTNSDGTAMAVSADSAQRPKQKIQGILGTVSSEEGLSDSLGPSPDVFKSVYETVDYGPSKSNIQERAAEQSELADILTSLVIGDPVIVSFEDWSRIGLWHTAVTSLVKKGYEIRVHLVENGSIGDLSISVNKAQ